MSENVSVQPEHTQINPIATLDRMWRIAEKVTLSVSFILVFGTVGYVSVLALT